MKLTPEEMALATGGELLAQGPAGEIQTDTRSLSGGAWFLALSGENFDGHDYLEQARANGCAGVVVEREPESWDGGLLLVEDSLKALQDCAAFVRNGFEGPVVGITGSAGKTTTRAMVGSVLSTLGPVHQPRGNFNNHIGLPLTLLSLPEDAAALVLELGMSAPGEIDLLQAISRPNVRVITLVAAAHLEGTGTLAATAGCKQELFDGAQPGDCLVVNADDSWVRAMPHPPGTRDLRFGESKGCDCRLQGSQILPGEFTTLAVLELPEEEIEVRLAAPGRHIALDACAAAAVGLALGISGSEIAAGLEAWRPVGMRMRIETLPGGITIINDAYNSNPASLKASLETLAQSRGTRLVALLGDMLELGESEVEAHEAAVRLAAEVGVGLLGLVGPRLGHHAELAQALVDGDVLCAETSESLGHMLQGGLQPGDVVLLKGSRSMRMEQVLQALGLGGH